MTLLVTMWAAGASGVPETYGVMGGPVTPHSISQASHSPTANVPARPPSPTLLSLPFPSPERSFDQNDPVTMTDRLDPLLPLPWDETMDTEVQPSIPIIKSLSLVFPDTE